MLRFLALLAQGDGTGGQDLIAAYGPAGVTIALLVAAIRLVWKENIALRAEIARLNADAVTRADRTAPLLADTIRILDEREPSIPTPSSPRPRRRTPNG